MMKYCLNCWRPHDSRYNICPNCGFDEKRAVYENALYRGAIIANRYRIENIIRTDSDFVTYLANDSRLQRKVEIKEYLPIDAVYRGRDRLSLFKKENSYFRIPFEQGANWFYQESQMLMQHGNNSNVSYIYDIFLQNNTVYTVNEILDNGNLATYLSEKGKLTQMEAMDIMIPLIMELENLKNYGIVHYDLSLENIMIVRDEKDNVKGKLTNFGGVKHLERGYRKSQISNTNGKAEPSYSDIYALGEILYQLVTGVEPPSMSERIRKRKSLSEPLKFPYTYNDTITEEFENAVMNALAFHEKDRTSSLDQLEEELISFEPVKSRYRRGGALNLYFWPSHMKIAVPAVSACIIALIIVLGSIHPNAIPAGMVQVPNYSGMSFEEAQEKIQADKTPLVIRQFDTQYSPDFEEGIILNQDPQAGQIEKKNSVVNVTLSTLAETYQMPNVIGKSEGEAKNALECMGVEVLTMQVPAADGLAKGSVLNQDIPPYESVSTGDVVTLKVTSDEHSKTAAAPQVESMTYEEALQTAKDSGVVIRVKKMEFTDEYPENTIIKQNIEPDAIVAEGDAIEVVVSQEVRTFEMPNLKYKDAKEAAQLMENIGVTVTESLNPNDTIPADIVFSQDIEKGTEVTPGESVTLNISTGAKPFAMPNLVGQTEDDAKESLEESGLAYQISYDFDELFEVGHVMAQDIPVGQEITRGSEVLITICSDTETVRVPSVVGMTEAEAAAAIESNGAVVTVQEIASSEMNNGKVVSQIPEVGTHLKKGDVVVINIGKATPPKTAPAEQQNLTPGGGDNANINTVKSVSLNYESLVFHDLGEQKLLKAQHLPLNAVPHNHRWTSSDSSVVAVDSETGLLLSRKNGTATITYECDGAKAECIVKVNATDGLVMIPPTLDFTEIGEIRYLECDSVEGGYKLESLPTWHSSDLSVATVDQEGYVKAVGDGTCYITCVVEGDDVSAKVTVKTNTVTEQTTVSTTQEQKVTDIPETVDSGLPPVTTETESESASESETEVLTTTTTQVQITEPVIVVDYIELKEHSFTFTSLNDSKTLEYDIYPVDAEVTDEIYWESDNSSVTVDRMTGTITPNSEGSAVISVHCGDHYDECFVEVSLPLQLESVYLNTYSLDFQSIGETQYLEAGTVPADYSRSSCVFRSTDDYVATVDQEGYVRSEAPGSCEIIVNIDGVEAACQVTVNDTANAGSDSYNSDEDYSDYGSGNQSTRDLSEYLNSPMDYMSMEFGLDRTYYRTYPESGEMLDCTCIEKPGKFAADASETGEVCRIDVFDGEYSLYQLTVNSSLAEIEQVVTQNGFNVSVYEEPISTTGFYGYYYEYCNNYDGKVFKVIVDENHCIKCLSLIQDNSYYYQ